MSRGFQAHWEKQSKMQRAVSGVSTGDWVVSGQTTFTVQAHRTHGRFIFLRTGPVDFL